MGFTCSGLLIYMSQQQNATTKQKTKKQKNKKQKTKKQKTKKQNKDITTD